VSHIANAECFDAWNGESGQRWADEADRRDAVLAPVAEVLLDASDLSSQEAVLDVGCGCGATTLAAARLTDGSRAVGLDISAPMLDVARARRDAAGLTQVEFLQADAQTHDFVPAFDIAISRFGTMFFSDPVAAFANLGHGLRPRGRVCLATWQPLAANEWLAVPGAALLRYGRLPDVAGGGPGMFGQSDEDSVAATLRAAGYGDITLVPVTVSMVLGEDEDAATEYLARSGVGRAVLETIPESQQRVALDAVRATLAEHRNREGVQLDGAIWVVHARRLR
jgi:SAM-dependent methyltransferase